MLLDGAQRTLLHEEWQNQDPSLATAQPGKPGYTQETTRSQTQDDRNYEE